MTAVNNALIPAGAVTYAYRSQRSRSSRGDFLTTSPALVLACLLCSRLFQVAATEAIASF